MNMHAGGNKVPVAGESGGPPLLYYQARLIDPARRLDQVGDLLIHNGRIVAVEGGGVTIREELPPETHQINCTGLCLAPGMIDLRAALGEPGFGHKESFVTGSQAAAAGGVTSLVCLPNTDPVIDDVALVEYVRRRADEAGLVSIYPAAAATKGLGGKKMTEIGLLQKAGALLFTDGVKAIASSLMMRRLLSYARIFEALIVQHPEDPELVSDGVMNEGEFAARLGLTGIPAMAEIIMVERDIRLAELTGGRLHFAHISTAAALEAIRRAKKSGLPITCDTAPPYFALTELAVGEYRSFAKLSPPLRSQADCEAVIEALADGTIDVVASDHIPQDTESKRLPFSQAAFGAIGLELLLPLLLEPVHGKNLSLLDALALVTDRPAQLLGLPVGRLEPGLRADLMVFDLNRAWRLEPSALYSKSKNTPFAGRPLQGQIGMTFVGGRCVYQADWCLKPLLSNPVA